jgi:hypothetical protein
MPTTSSRRRALVGLAAGAFGTLCAAVAAAGLYSEARRAPDQP